MATTAGAFGTCTLDDASSTQSIPDSSWTEVNFRPNEGSYAGGVIPSGDEISGWGVDDSTYMLFSIFATVTFASNATGARGIRLMWREFVEENTWYTRCVACLLIPNPAYGNNFPISISAAVPLNTTTDYVYVDVYQASGGALNIIRGDTENFTQFTVIASALSGYA